MDVDRVMEKPITIHRAIHDSEHPYTPTRRDTAQDTGLSYESAGLLWFLLSKPSDWLIIPQTLVRDDCNLRKVMRLFSELIEAGYMSRSAVRDDKGCFTGWTYAVFEAPNPVTKNSMSGQTHPMDNPADGFLDPIQNKDIKDSIEIPQKQTAFEPPANSEQEALEPAEVVVQSNQLQIRVYYPNRLMLPANVPEHPDFKAKATEPIAQPEPVECDAFGLPIPQIPRAPLSAPPEDTPFQEQDNPMGRVLNLLESGDGWGKPALTNDCKNAQMALDEYGEDWVTHAIREAKFKGKKWWGFANGCLENWKKAGQVNTTYDRQKPGAAPGYAVTPERQALNDYLGQFIR